MVKGGYQIINFSGVEFTKNTPMQLSNIYDKIEGTDKAILLSGLNVNGIDYRDVMCTPIVIGNSYVIKAFGFRIYISDIDIVTVEDEILSLDGYDFSVNPSQTVSYGIYNRLQECLNGNYRTFKIGYNDSIYYSTFIGSHPESNMLYFVIGTEIKTLYIENNEYGYSINVN